MTRNFKTQNLTGKEYFGGKYGKYCEETRNDVVEANVSVSCHLNEYQALVFK